MPHCTNHKFFHLLKSLYVCALVLAVLWNNPSIAMLSRTEKGEPQRARGAAGTGLAQTLLTPTPSPGATEDNYDLTTLSHTYFKNIKFGKREVEVATLKDGKGWGTPYYNPPLGWPAKLLKDCQIPPQEQEIQVPTPESALVRFARGWWQYFTGARYRTVRRVRRYNPHDPPLSAIGFLTAHDREGNIIKQGTGFMISPYHVLTAGHLLFSPDKQEWWPFAIHFSPAQDEGYRPAATHQAVKVMIPREYNPHTPSFDFGLITLDRPIGKYTGWFGLMCTPSDEIEFRRIYVTGYPAIKIRKEKGVSFPQMWGMGMTRLASFTDNLLFHNIETSPGNDGGPIAALFDFGLYAIGVHAKNEDPAAKEKESSGPRFNKARFDLIVKWLENENPIDPDENKRMDASITPQLNQNFLPRKGVTGEDMINEIRSLLNKDDRNKVQELALIGMGGAGKSELALKFALEAERRKEYGVIGWIRSETQEQLIEDFKMILNMLKIPYSENAPPQAIKRAVYEALRDKKEKWLLIFDNVPNPVALRDLSFDKNGHVLITSQDTSTGWANPFEVPPFLPEESTRFLMDKLFENLWQKDRADDETQAKKIAEKLGHLPLALSHALAYMNANEIGMPAYFEAYEHEEASFLNSDLDPRSRTIRTTFAMAIDGLIAKANNYTAKIHIAKIGQQIIYKASLMKADVISVGALKGLTLNGSTVSEHDIMDALMELNRYSLIKWVNIGTKEHFFIHPMVQAVGRNLQGSPTPVRGL